MSPTMYPYLSYRDAATALHFLEEAFGFTVSVRWDDSHGTVQHAEAALGDGAMMLGTAEHATAPLEGSSVGQGIYVYVEGVDASFERACAGGARVVYPPEDTAWGTRRYRVLDPEGYEWSFGNYRPGTGAGGSRVPRRDSLVGNFREGRLEEVQLPLLGSRVLYQ